jgi:hypothetical protein
LAPNAKNEISSIRLLNQQIVDPQFERIQDLIEWMGAMQAQVFNMMRWAVGIRMSEATDQSIKESFNKGEIIRTHLLRPTWHLVSSNDFFWILELTRAHLKPRMRSRQNQLELTAPLLNQCKTIVEKRLENGDHLTREEIMILLENSGISTSGQRAAHIMMDCELDGIVCSGALKDKKQTYALAAERVQVKNSFTREESLYKLAQKYFTSHGPASLKDFIWWSGLPVKDAKKALEMVTPELDSIETDSKEYWLSSKLVLSGKIKYTAHLIPAYDEFIISYTDRADIILAEHHKKAISDNGIFWPVVVINGKAKGVWKTNLKKNKIILETDYFQPVNRNEKELVRNASEKYSRFLTLEIETLNKSSKRNS